MVAQTQQGRKMESGGILKSKIFTDQERAAYALKRKDDHQIVIEELGFYSPRIVWNLYLDIISRNSAKKRAA